jgi:hypothetical protein
VRIDSHPGRARYLTWGQPELTGLRPPWRHIEQLGSAHRLCGPGGELLVVTRQRGRHLTECEISFR